MNETKNKPVMSVKVGAVRAAIWKNQRQTGNGQAFESVQVVLERTYKDRNGSYSSTHSLGINDIPKAIMALTKAYEYLMEQPEGGEAGGEEQSSP